MGCSPSKSNAIQPISESDSSKANGSLPENSSATANGSSNDKHFTTKGLDKSAPSVQNNCSEDENQSNNLKLQNTNTAATAATNITPGYNDSQRLSQAVSDALQHHGNHECHVLGNQPSLSTPKLPCPKIASLRTTLRGPGTESQIEFFKMLDRKIEAGPDYEDN